MPDPDPASPNCINGWRSRIFTCASSGMTVNILKHLIQSFENRPQTPITPTQQSYNLHRHAQWVPVQSR